MGKKKALGALSALALCLALAPAAALAEEPDWTGWTALTATTTAIDGGSGGAGYYLAGDVSVGATIEVRGGTEESPVVLDLNGHVLASAGGHGVIRVADGAHLVLRDSRPDADTKYSWSMDEYGEPVLHGPGGSAPEDAAPIFGGAVAGGRAPEGVGGGGVHVAPGGSFAMEGGSIAACGASGQGGGGVYVASGGSFAMSGGSISGCESIDLEGGGVYVAHGDGGMDSGGTRAVFAMSGGSISGCEATFGGGVRNYGEFAMQDGEIRDCTASVDGGGVDGGGKWAVFTMSGGSISGCEAISGGGVNNYGEFAMRDGEIRNCTASENGGGVINSGEMDARGGTVGGSVRNTSPGSIANASGAGGTVFRGEVTNIGAISGGTFEDEVTNKAGGEISGGTFEDAVTNEAGGAITGGVFEAAVGNAGAISGGTFEAAVGNAGEISGGTFEDAVTNEAGGAITGGIFRGEVGNAGEISGGVFYWIASGGSFRCSIADRGGKVVDPHVVTFDPGCDGADPAAYGPATVAGGGTVLPEPAEPGREGWALDGWFADGSSEPYGFDEPVTSDLALRAGWTHVAHAGGAATCTERAVCGVCGEEYGAEPAGHGDVEHVAARAATERSEGNVEYWRCLDCGRYYADEALTREVSPSDVVLPRLEPAPVLAETGDAAPAAAAALALAGGAAALVARRRCA